MLPTRVFVLFILALLGMNFPIRAQTYPVNPIAVPDSAQADSIYSTPDVDQQPSYPGGAKELGRFFNTRLIHPARQRAMGITGTVLVAFVVEQNGTLSSPMVVSDIGGDCGKEAVRLIGIMPAWTPATHKGKPVRCRYELPIHF